MSASRNKLRQIGRVVYDHRWEQIEDWARTLDELADLSDEEIVDIQKMSLMDQGSPADD